MEKGQITYQEMYPDNWDGSIPKGEVVQVKLNDGSLRTGVVTHCFEPHPRNPGEYRYLVYDRQGPVPYLARTESQIIRQGTSGVQQRELTQHEYNVMQAAQQAKDMGMGQAAEMVQQRTISSGMNSYSLGDIVSFGHGNIGRIVHCTLIGPRYQYPEDLRYIVKDKNEKTHKLEMAQLEYYPCQDFMGMLYASSPSLLMKPILTLGMQANCYGLATPYGLLQSTQDDYKKGHLSQAPTVTPKPEPEPDWDKMVEVFMAKEPLPPKPIGVKFCILLSLSVGFLVAATLTAGVLSSLLCVGISGVFAGTLYITVRNYIIASAQTSSKRQQQKELKDEAARIIMNFTNNHERIT